MLDYADEKLKVTDSSRHMLSLRTAPPKHSSLGKILTLSGNIIVIVLSCLVVVMWDVMKDCHHR